MRWSCRVGPCLSSYHRARNIQISSYILTPISATQELQSPLIRSSCPHPLGPLTRDFSTSATAPAPAPDSYRDEAGLPKNPKKRSSLTIVFGGVGICAFVATALWWTGITGPGSDEGDIINRSTFSAFTITSKEQVSPTAFILTVRSNTGGGSGSGVHSARIREAWAHGLWSVEIKQPQLQIARHYTPLPPLPSPPPLPLTLPISPPPSSPSSSLTAEDSDEELRFLIRKMDGGEMSSYLSRQRVGDVVWLRGPHLGFDAARRLGDADAGRQRRVVFLAGGTGVAPALQVARRLLDDNYDDGERSGGDEDEKKKKPVVSILWANRRAVDALGRREQLPPKTGRFFGKFWRRGAVSSQDGQAGGSRSGMLADSSSLSRQIHEMERRHPHNFRVHYFVDDEKAFIGAKDVVAATLVQGVSATAAAAAARDQKPRGQVPPAEECPWHSATALEKLPNDKDSSRSGGKGGGSSTDSACPCVRKSGERAGANLLFVSGPDGFIEAYAGPKKWHEGGEMQGPVRGLIGRLKKDGELDGWLVLKM